MIINGNCFTEIQKMESNSIDFIVTDPPYGLNFMNKKWDSEVPNVEIWKEALRICKPGSMLAAFGGSRTHHHLMIALEQAGWEIRDAIMWLYGSGFPKSHNKFGLEGYGTALKPAYEPIILAMKPLDDTYKQNVEKWGIGGINIDDSRILPSQNDDYGRSDSNSQGKINAHNGFEGKSFKIKERNGNQYASHKGRWPANIILDEEAGQLLDEQSGILKSPGSQKNRKNNSGNSWKNSCKEIKPANYLPPDIGGASRFFYCSKVSSKERDGSTHPTMKPIALMEYIIKLLAPPNNPTLLDPFMGSGSTLLAAQNLSIKAIGIEKEKEYCEIANKRLQHNSNLFSYNI